MYEDKKVITAEEAMERLGNLYNSIKIKIANHNEVDELYDEYITNIFDSNPKDIHVYLYDNNTLYFTYENIKDHKEHTLTEEYIIKPTDSYDSYTEIPWYPYRDLITKIESDKIIAPASLKYFFYYFSKITDVNGLSNWNTSFVTDINSIFMGCSSLANLDGLSNWNTSAITNMNNVFCYCSKITNIDSLKDWNTSAVTSMNYLFYYCSKITTFSPIDSWDISNVISHIVTFSGTTGTRPKWATNW